MKVLLLSSRVGKGLCCAPTRVLIKSGGFSTEQLFYSPDMGQDALPTKGGKKKIILIV